ncbi:putative reverse transcriptase zinc-binding domain-containing protein [Helianthus annuus]|nr:putative reverse transcriptase zinc-binding domain-containing protein [Helianthus annuus]
MYCPDWCKWLPSKCNVFTWRMGLDRLATMLKRRNIDRGDPSCVLCGEGEELVEHLFTSCSIVSMLWPIISMWCKIPNILTFSVKDLPESHEHVGLKGNKKMVVQGIIKIGCWSIWKAMNDARFNNKVVKLEGIIREIKTVGFLWLNSRSKNIEISWEEWCKFVNM